MIEFIEECRREWRRLGVPDAIANEMAADLSADIEEAEREGGSAEDVLGTSLFDPRRFAAAWAGARGVTAPAAPTVHPVPTDPPAPRQRERSTWYRQVTVVALAALGLLTVLTATALAIGRHSVAVAASAGRIFVMPGSASVPVPVSPSPPVRSVVSGPMFALQSNGPVTLLVFALLFAALVILALAILYWSPWSRRASGREPG
jgi:hypothetical protein